MRYRCLALIFLLAVSPSPLPTCAQAGADPAPNLPRLYDDEGDGFSPADFERRLLTLKAEREGLSSDWQALRKRNAAAQPALDAEQKRFEAQMRKALEDLRKRRQDSPLPPYSAAELIKRRTDADTVEVKQSDKGAAEPDGKAATGSAPVDALAQALTLMRSKQYEEALATFQQVDLKGKRANERAPIQYLKACCLLHLGKASESAELLQEVANYRGDEKLAGFAQWQLEMLRWQRDIAQKLNDIRQRHQNLEKR